LTFLTIYAIIKYNLRKELVMKMFYADITIEFKNGSKGAKIIQAHSMEQVMSDAAHFVRQRILEGREILEVHGNDLYMVESHKVKGYEGRA